MRRNAGPSRTDGGPIVRMISQHPCQNEITTMTQVIEKIGAGEGNRTLVISLEGCCSTIELHPRRTTFNSPPSLLRNFGRAAFAAKGPPTQRCRREAGGRGRRNSATC